MNGSNAGISRRTALAQAGLMMGAAFTANRSAAQEPPGPKTASAKTGFVFALNTGSIRGQKLGLAKEIEIAAQAGYQGIEVWVDTIQQYVQGGGSLRDIKNRIHDLGLTVEGAIGFASWIVDDEAQRTKGFEQVKRDMDLVAQIGGTRLAAPPAGATREPGLDLLRAAERYRALLELGDQMAVVPQLELWGFSANLHRLGEVVFVTIESGHPKACVLADVFHIYKGGSDFGGLKLLSGRALQVFHMNDYPAAPPRDQANDGHRVFPGDGVGPLPAIVRDLHSTGGGKVLSLELFNRQYYERDALEVAKEGLAKMQQAVQQALGS